MDYVYHFGHPSRLYLNVTNRCTNSCVFCVRRYSNGLGGAELRGSDEPDLDALLGAIDDLQPLRELEEIVWCGFGEPSFRLDLILDAGIVFRRWDVSVRLNTNGHGCLIEGRDVLPELAKVIDTISVSLNSPNKTRYLELCRPLAGDAAWEATLDVLSRASSHFKTLRASVVGHALSEPEIDECRQLASELGCYELLVR